MLHPTPPNRPGTCVLVAGQRSAAAPEVLALDGVGRQGNGHFEGNGRFVDSSKPFQEIGACRVVQVVVVELDPVDDRQRTCRPQIVVDVAGWFGPGAGGLAYLPSAPVRLLDTRLNGGKPTNADNAVHVDGVSILNIAAVDSAALGYVTARPCGSPLLSSLINTTTGEDTANLIAVGGDVGGNVCVRSNILSQLVVDQVAAFAP